MHETRKDESQKPRNYCMINQIRELFSELLRVLKLFPNFVPNNPLRHTIGSKNFFTTRYNYIPTHFHFLPIAINVEKVLFSSKNYILEFSVVLGFL